MTKMSGAKALLESLDQQNVEVIFGILGGAICRFTTRYAVNQKSGTYLADMSREQRTQPKAMHEPAEE